MNAILYARFSPRPNVRECESVERQLAELREYCQRRKYAVRGEFSDRAMSGADARRPGLWDAICACKRGFVLVVRSFDRLSRDEYLFAVIRHKMNRQGATIRSIMEESASDDSPTATLLRIIFQAVAEYQREIIRARTRAAMRRHQANGRRMSYHVPFGWRIDPNDASRIIENVREQDIIAKMVNLRAEGLSLRAICRQLTLGNDECRGTTWHPATIQRALKRQETL